MPSQPLSKPASNQKHDSKSRPPALKNDKTHKLAIAAGVPMCLTMATVFLFGSSNKYRAMAKPFWFPPLWLIHAASLGCSGVMGVSSWVVWLKGGFRAESDALPLYIAQVSVGVVWDPLVVVIGSAWLGFVFCVVHFGTLVGCYWAFGNVKRVAGELVKPCLGWVGVLAFLTLNLAFL